MRQFLVLGYKTTNTNEPGVIVHLGNQNSVAIDVVKAAGGEFARKELFELAVPRQRKFFEGGGQGTGDRGQEEIASLPRNDGAVRAAATIGEIASSLDSMDAVDGMDDMDGMEGVGDDPVDDDDEQPVDEVAVRRSVKKQPRVNGKFVKK